ncbi:MAG: DDE-type integrase/transposase/recombinase [Porticoccus sp.]|nr:DDE-type integrase/transposase/recombinase [Porticoccus sp.]
MTPYGNTFHLDEFYVNVNGKQRYLLCAVDQGGEVIDVSL